MNYPFLQPAATQQTTPAAAMQYGIYGQGSNNTQINSPNGLLNFGTNVPQLANQYAQYGQGSQNTFLQNSALTSEPTVDPNAFGTSDYLNFGLGAASIGLGAYYQDKELGLQEDALALNQQKYSDYIADRDNLDAVSASRAATAKEQIGG